MLSPNALRELSIRYQTAEFNVRREYLQHLFLSYMYQERYADGIFFKGGTALRIAFGSPRFSEDLDFSATSYTVSRIKNSLINTLKEIEREGIKTDIVESKETTGGYLGHFQFFLDAKPVAILVQFSSRSPRDRSEIMTISGDFVRPYTLVLLEHKQLVAEKIQAVLTRAKPRDFYDVYFLIRSGLLGKKDKQLLVEVKRKLKNSSIRFDTELKQYLPKSHWLIFKNFPDTLTREIDRNI